MSSAPNRFQSVLFLALSLALCSIFIAPSGAQTAGQAGVQALAPAGAARFALVIGNGSYAELGKLKNPANDAADMSQALGELGFKVKLLVDADLTAMEDAVVRLGNDLAQSANSIGFFYYAGHGIQAAGTNYLIPADARIASEAFLKNKALPAQSVLETLQASRNALNIVVLDACRDNPFSWGRSSTRGLSVVGNQPPGSVVVYATSAGSVAQDGTERNGVFTSELLKQIKTPGVELKDMFNRTGKGVSTVTGGKQVPAVYNQFFDSAYLAGSETAQPPSPPIVKASSSSQSPVKTPSFVLTPVYGRLAVTAETAGTLYVDGKPLGELPLGRKASLGEIEVGDRVVEMRYALGEPETKTVTVREGAETPVLFTWKKATLPAQVLATPTTPAALPAGMVFVPGGTFTMGSPASESGRYNNETQHQVSLSPFAIAATDVTVGEFRAFVNATGYKTSAELNAGDYSGGYVYSGGSWVTKPDASWKNPYYNQTDSYPVVLVSWYDAVAFCNWRSQVEGKSLAYRYKGEADFKKWPSDWNAKTHNDIACDFAATGYRLPTEAEWEYAAKGGPGAGSLAVNAVYAGSVSIDDVAWYSSNSGMMAHPVAQKKANALGLYDMAGNVWQWCQDWYDSGYYGKSSAKDPRGPDSGDYRVLRGGSWSLVASYLRSAFRFFGVPWDRGAGGGFRLLCPQIGQGGASR